MSKTPLPRIQIDDVIQVISDLSKVLAKETTYLKKMQVKEAASLQEEKIRLVYILETVQRALKQDPTVLVAAGKKPQYAEVLRIYHDLLAENFIEISKASEINRCVVGFISEAAKEQVLQVIGYNTEGKFSYRPLFNGIIPPLTVNNCV